MHSDEGLQRICVVRRNLVKKNNLLFANTYKERTAFLCMRREILIIMVSVKKGDNNQEDPIMRL